MGHWRWRLQVRLTDAFLETDAVAIKFVSSTRERRLAVKEKRTKNKPSSPTEDDLRTEYDAALIRSGERGKYAKRYQAGTNVVLLAPDVANAFPDSQAVNSPTIADASRNQSRSFVVSSRRRPHPLSARSRPTASATARML